LQLFFNAGSLFGEDREINHVARTPRLGTKLISKNAFFVRADVAKAFYLEQ
jgi:hypothetical protein